MNTAQILNSHGESIWQGVCLATTSRMMRLLFATSEAHAAETSGAKPDQALLHVGVIVMSAHALGEWSLECGRTWWRRLL